MNHEIQRRQFLQIGVGSTAVALGAANFVGAPACRRSPV